MERILTRNVDNERALTVAGYEAAGGYQALRKAVASMTPTPSPRKSRSRDFAAAEARASPAG